MPPSTPPPLLPRWLVVLLSLLIAGHLLAVGATVLASTTGPWPTMMGSNLYGPPQFALAVNEVTADKYLKPIKMTHNYHFATNSPAARAARFEVLLKDDNGNELQRLKFPEEGANAAVRHRQALLAQALTLDVPVPPPQGETVAPPSGQVKTVTIWDSPDNRGLILRTVPEHLVPRDRPVFRPSDWSLLLARSYTRHLCRQHGAASAEVIRYTKEAVSPEILTLVRDGGTPPPGAMDILMANFGELPK